MIKGIIPALVTPLNEDESVRIDTVTRLIIDLSAQGADGFYIGGATGEGLALRTEEREILTEAAVAAASENKGVIVQVASTNYADMLMLARHAEEKGASAVSATAPLFFKYDEDDVYNYYKRLAEAVHIPVMVYYNPSANFPMSAEFAKRLFEIDNVTAIKWTSTDFYGLARLKDITNGEMTVMNGFDEMLLSGLSAGADGGIGTTYNYALRHVRRIYDSFIKNDMADALISQKKIAAFVAALNGDPIIPASKALLEGMGYAVGNATFPMRRYSPEKKQELYRRLFPLVQ